MACGRALRGREPVTPARADGVAMQDDSISRPGRPQLNSGVLVIREQICIRTRSKRRSRNTRAESEYRIVIGRGRYTDELVVEVERPDGVSPDASALRKTRLRRRFKEVLMVCTAVRVIEPSIYDVQMFKARRVTDRRSL
jgi:phenylacetate-coenzyme A ligase PaaK-like adenylate-forming protein